ncbi:MAG TPA: GNAT family N-acetyltransferase [Vicinamibacterales bacterium]|jgi:GNAT superfamily N-acetyltransferase|nr:GNAT family N-acetyltransferase [Vicinamibacterales bacterium]
MGYTIRAASAADIPHVVDHRERMFREMGTVCDYAAMADACTRWYIEALPAGTYRGWMAETDGRVIGGGGLIVTPWSPGPSRFDPRMAWVYNVFVEPAHRGRGVARRLMEAMHAWCREHRIERLALNATEAGARVYRTQGYTVVPDPMMRLDLP